MDLQKSAALRLDTWGAIYRHSRKQSSTASALAHQSSLTLGMVQALKGSKSIQTTPNSGITGANAVSRAAEIFPGYRGGMSIFDPRHPLTCAPPTPERPVAAKTVIEKDQKMLQISGSKRLDPSKANPALFDLRSNNGRDGMTTRGLFKTKIEHGSETGRTAQSAPQKLPKRKATEALGESEEADAKGLAGSEAGPSRQDSVIARSGDAGGVKVGSQVSAKGTSSELYTIATADGSKRRRKSSGNPGMVQSLPSDEERIDAPSVRSPSKALASDGIVDGEGSRTAIDGAEMGPAGPKADEAVDAATSRISRPAKRKRDLEAELEIAGTTALGWEAKTDSDRYVKLHQWHGKWYSCMGTEKPDWSEGEKVVDLTGGRSDGYAGTSSRGRRTKEVSYKT